MAQYCMPHTFFENQIMISNHADHGHLIFIEKRTLSLHKVPSKIDRTVISKPMPDAVLWEIITLTQITTYST